MRKTTTLIFTTFIILCIPLVLSAKDTYNFHFKRITVDNGLSESSVYCIMQDIKGFIWFGTKDGLNKYDGNSFKTFRGLNSNIHKGNTLQNNFIRSMIQTDSTTIYVGTDAGLYSLNIEDEAFNLISTATKDGYRVTSAVNSLLKDKNGNLWIGTMLQGVFVFSPKKNELRKVDAKGLRLEQNATWTIYEDKSGVIWVGNRVGLLRYNNNTEQLEAIEGMFSTQSSSEHEVLSIYEDDNGMMWLGTWGAGLRMYNKQSNTYKEFFNNKSGSFYITHIRSLFHYSDENIFIGSDDGLYIFNTKTFDIQRLNKPNLSYSLSDQNVYCITKDREGGIWIGTYFGGINYLTPFPSNIELFHPSSTPYSLSGKAVSQFCEDESGNLWIATEDGGINYMDTKTKRITQPVKTSYHNTHALLLDGDDLWIGTFSRGIDIYNTKTGRITNMRSRINDETTIDDDCIFSLYKTKSGDIYAGTPVGLNKYNRLDRSFERISEANGFIYDLEEDSYGNLWVATYGSGVKKFNVKADKWISYDYVCASDDPIVNSKLTDIYIDSQNRILLSSEGRGFFIYDYRSDTFINFSEKDGLPNNVVYGILDDSYGNLWASCNKGIVCISSDFKNIKLYNKDDGLQSNQFNFKASYKTQNGKLYFGGVNGFNSFYPKNLFEKENLKVPPVEITQIQLLDKKDKDINSKLHADLIKKGQIEIPYNKASFSISYISLSYVSESKNQYAYKLKDVDEEWNYVDNNKTVTYVDLPPGEYIFQVKASNNDDVWNEEGASLIIKILPPFWLTTTAKLLYLLITVLLVYITIQYYLKKNIEKQKKILDAYRTEQETLAFKSKIDFFTTIAHEIRTPLSLINAPLEEIISSDDGKETTKQNLSIIEKNCDRLNTLVNQLLDFRKMDSLTYTVNPEKIDLQRFIQEMFFRFNKTAQKKGIELKLNNPEAKIIEIYSDIDALTKIVGNLLTNAMKYAKDTIILSLEEKNNGQYSISIEDNGPGISDEHKNLVFDPFYQVRKEDRNIGTGIGLSLVKHLTEALNGSITVSDAKPKGTIFTFTLSDIKDNNNLTDPIQENEYSEDSPSYIKQPLGEEIYSILIVDDNPEIVSYLQGSLKNEYYVSLAYNAQEAFSILKGDRIYDLIISDIMMPDIDGISFTRTVKSDVNYSHIPIVLLSAKTEVSTKIEGLQSGADVFIEKPFSIMHLKAQIKSLFDNRRNLLETFNRTPSATYTSLVTNKKDEEFFKKLNAEIELHISDEEFSVESLVDTLGMSRSNLQRKLKSICGVTPGDYLRDYRLKRACKLLLEEDMRINEVAFNVGFSSASYFTKVFTKVYKVSPKEFISQNRAIQK
ncbi:two-component regulator propeller domain-containing protein [Dysgonomonas sp. Marseille-P4361]|uniref:hybrid sensor histidine kinase/response regulator transcription factor n=1 Tax=Dysgonomonas sp. Marseille-P4361 TaxID=2161820 RepID=UPI000D551043|nr:two-component regulator propeller domain-containing protein [Dysgonomonas sp. Marseille-P4361]